MKGLIQGTSICRPSFIFCILILVVLSSPPAKAERIEVALGGKGISGPYFPTAGTIANSVNQTRDDHGLRITVTSRRESVTILTAVVSGEFEFGVVQSHWIGSAYKGRTEGNESPQSALRSVFNVQAEQIGLVAKVQSGIRRLEDLKGRRVLIAGPRSDLRYGAMQILTAAGIDPRSDLTTIDAAVEEAPDLMQDDAIDAFFYVVGITNRAFIDLVSDSQKVRLVPISGPGIENYIATHPLVEKAIVPIAAYPYFANTSDVETVGFKAELITTAGVPATTVYTVAREVFENLNNFKTRHPASVTMTRKKMTGGLAVSVHSGAEKFYKESGLGYSVIQP